MTCKLIINYEGNNRMGFYLMILSMLSGICLIGLGLCYRNRHFMYNIIVVVGICLVGVAIYVARPH
jgi:uncharacterized membrane protein